jgi:hypothetical protein
MRARKLQQEQALMAAAAAEANSTFGDERSRQIAGQLYAHKVELVKTRAEAAGVVPRDGDRDLIELSPEEFGRWVTERLEPAEREARESKEL